MLKVVEFLSYPHPAISHGKSVASELFRFRHAFVANAYNINSAALPDQLTKEISSFQPACLIIGEYKANIKVGSRALPCSARDSTLPVDGVPVEVPGACTGVRQKHRTCQGPMLQSSNPDGRWVWLGRPFRRAFRMAGMGVSQAKENSN